MIQTDILSKAIRKYGVEPQLAQHVEEVGELLQAINKVRRLGGMKDLDNTKIIKPNALSSVKYSLAYGNLCSEIADNEIMLEQLKLMVDPEWVEISKQRKLERLAKNLK